MRREGWDRGFTLIELGVILVLIGLVLAIAVPSLRTATSGSTLGAAADGLSMQIALAREKAVDTGTDLIVRFALDSLDADFHVREPGGAVSGQWSLPPGVSYSAQSARGLTLTRDGRASPAVYVILLDRDGHVDTVSVQTSGMVVTH